MDDLKLQLVGVAEFVEIFLAGKQGLGVQVELVVEGSLAIHDGVKVFPVHADLLLQPFVQRC